MNFYGLHFHFSANARTPYADSPSSRRAPIEAAEKLSFGEVAATLRRHNLNRCNAQMAG